MKPTTTTNHRKGPARRRPASQRRGTVLLFALGVLAVIAVAALSYVTFVRLDRQSSAAVARGVGNERQVSIVRDKIGDLLTADLYGGKVVTNDVPRIAGRNQLWPRMFEDGEYRDYPWTDFNTFDYENKADPNYKPSNDAVLILRNSARFDVAPPDDAWLAATEPVWIGNANGFVNKAYWPQITNLRSAYTYDDRGTRTIEDDRWVRGDGRYVDLGQFFLDKLTNGGARANPGTDLLDLTLSDSLGSKGGAVRPSEAAGDYARAPFEQIGLMDYVLGDPNDTDRLVTLDKSDERQWVDTDGDLRPDARWQVLEELGNFNGLVWVVAARIVDASALVNYNAAIDGGYRASAPEQVATGHTPADIDLERLLVTSRPGTDPFGRFPLSAYPSDSPFSNIDVSDANFNQAYTTHVLERIHAKEVYDQLFDAGIDTTLRLSPGWTWDALNPSGRLDQGQRDAMYRWFGSSPYTSRLDLTQQNVISIGYPRNDFVDLNTYWGVNQRNFLSTVEETLDSPLGLPTETDPDNPNRTIGPLQAAALGDASRRFGTGYTGDPSNEGRPTATEIRSSTRRLLTPINGSSLAGPITPMNMDDLDLNGDQRYAAQFNIPKVPLQGFSASNVPDAYQAFVDALAPLATDETRSAALAGPNNAYQINGTRLDSSNAYHYGGGAGGPGLSLPGFGGLQSGAEGPAFALLTAAEMAVNLADASDADNTPTVARLLTTTEESARGGGLYDCPSTAPIELGTSFAQGDVPTTLLTSAPTMLGDPVTNGRELEEACRDGTTDTWEAANEQKGVTIVGLERHPYITEVFSAAAYTSVAEAGLGNSPAEYMGTIDPSNPNYQLGSLLAFKLSNPWDTDLHLDPYQIRMLKDSTVSLDPAGAADPSEMLVFGFESGQIIGAHETRVFLYFFDGLSHAHPDTEWPDYTIVGAVKTDANNDDIIQTEYGVAGSLLFKGGGLVDTTRLVLLDDAGAKIDDDAFPTTNQKRVFFQDIAGQNLVVVLMQTNVPGIPTGAVVDKIENPSPAAVPSSAFPAILDTGYDLKSALGQAYFRTELDYDSAPWQLPDIDPCALEDPQSKFDGGKINGRVLVTGSLTRPADVAANMGGTGFPPYAMDFGRDQNWVVKGSGATNAQADSYQFDPISGMHVYAHAWLEKATDVCIPKFVYPAIVRGGEGQLPGYLVVENNGFGLSTVPDDLKQFVLDSSLSTTVNALADSGFLQKGLISDWQLFCPDKDLYAVADLGMISTVANVCLNNDYTTLDAWQTVGEQLARSIDYNYETFAGGDFSSPSTSPNPYIGTLDFSRFVPRGSVFSGLPNNSGDSVNDESLALPLAVRVFDRFEGLKTWNDQTLVNGVMNVNTMPERAMETLPLLAPGSSSVLPMTNERWKLIERYRSGLVPDAPNPSDIVSNTPDMITNLSAGGIEPSLRRSDKIASPGVVPGSGFHNPNGFATAGELAILDQWAGPEIMGTDGFLAMGKAGQGPDDGPPVDVWPTGGGDQANGGADPMDDAEERLALYRAVSNLVSSRSDVYIAWFVIRGYDPDAIEGIDMTTYANPIDGMENKDPEFTPAYESRWLVVYDRSNVKRPTDRPRVILQAELPSAKP